jgi:colicin import membrane protein
MTQTNSVSSYILPLLLAIIVHVIVGISVDFEWDRRDDLILDTNKTMYLNASLVSENPLRAKQREQDKARQKRRLERKRANELQAEQKKQRELKALNEQRKKEELLKQKEQINKLEEPVVTEIPLVDEQALERERQAMQESLAQAISSELDFQIAVTDDEKAQAYVGQIQREIIHNWSRPPSARNGMQALLKVFLVPTGEVVDVVVIESSGNDAFDRSAVQAVRKAQQFAVPVDSRQFERNFREFSVLFRPEDLRL